MSEQATLDHQTLEIVQRQFTQAGALTAEGRLQEAASLYMDVLRVLPTNFAVLCNLGTLRSQLGELPQAVTLLRQALAVQPGAPVALLQLGLALADLQDAAAIPTLEQVLVAEPDNLIAHLGLGGAYAQAGRNDEAIASYDRILQADPDHAPTLVNIARVLRHDGQLDRALLCCQRVLALRPGSAEAHYNTGTLLRAMGRQDAAARQLMAAITLDPLHARALLNLANIRKEQDGFDEAAEYLERAIALQPDLIAALNNLGHIRREQGRADEAIALHEAAVAIDPADAHSRLALVMAQLPIAYHDVTEIDRRRQAYTDRLEAWASEIDPLPQPGTAVSAIGASQPFYLPYQGHNDRALQMRYGGAVCRVLANRYGPARLPAAPAGTDRIRVGIVSGFFQRHSNWKLPVSGWLRGLDRQRFAVFGYHTSSKRDDVTDEARDLCEGFVQGPKTTEQWRAAILHDEPHVLIYPELGMDPMAVQLAGQRLAPVQCTSWGQPVTSGLPTIDLFLSSELMEPEDADTHYSERLIRLPGLSTTYELYQIPADMPARSRADFGLREGAIVYWCGQSLYKLLPQHDAVFPRIAKAVGSSQFAFIRFRYGDAVNDLVQDRLRAAFAAEGLRAADHVVMLPHMGKHDFVASFSQADVFLDSIGWSGCNTLLESMTHDLPVVTQDGDFMRGRHGGAILRGIGLDDLVCADKAAYCELAIRLGQDAVFRADCAGRIRANKHRLVNDTAPIRVLENVMTDAVRAAYA